MGYQESYVRVKDESGFDGLVEQMKNLGEDYFDNNPCANPVRIITLEKPISGNLEYMCMPERKYNFEAGTKFVYVVGERFGQRNASCLMGNNAPKDLEIYFTECFPSSRIFTEEGFAKHEEFSWK